MNAPSEVRFTLASPFDEAALRRLLRENPMRGRITITLEREPDYFRGTAIAGARDETIAAFAGPQLVCMGRCVTRPCWLNGAVAPVGYLGELRLDASARGQVEILRRGYAFFRERHQDAPAAAYFTSIAEDNLRARRLLERGLPGWPRYTFLQAYTTFILPARRSRATPAATGAAVEELAELLNAEGSRTHLAAAWTAADLRALAPHGLTPADFHVLRDGGQIVGCAALWDQRRFRQTMIRDYAGILRPLRPLVNAVGRCLGWPLLPAPGTELRHAFVSPFALQPRHASRLPAFLAQLAHAAADRGLTHLTFGLPAEDPRGPLLQAHFRPQTYSSRLYRVTWPEDGPPVELDRRPFAPDVALL